MRSVISKGSLKELIEADAFLNSQFMTEGYYAVIFDALHKKLKHLIMDTNDRKTLLTLKESLSRVLLSDTFAIHEWKIALKEVEHKLNLMSDTHENSRSHENSNSCVPLHEAFSQLG